MNGRTRLCAGTVLGMREWPEIDGVLEFPSGRRIRGGSWRRRGEFDLDPDFAIILLGREPTDAPWPYRWVCWPDFGVPADRMDALEALREAWRRSEQERVAIMCGGGIGRTGTALSALVTLSGTTADQAITWVRERYHPRAVETPWQRRWVRRLEPGNGSSQHPFSL